MRRTEFLAATVLLASWTSVCHAQVEATVSGQVVDETDGAPLAGAGVTVLDAAGAPTGAVTNAEGRFTIIGLTPGAYRIQRQPWWLCGPHDKRPCRAVEQRLQPW